MFFKLHGAKAGPLINERVAYPLNASSSNTNFHPVALYHPFINALDLY